MSTLFSCLKNGEYYKLPRERTSLTTTGYQLYPYFGGDETAPHPISIDIQPL